MKLEVGMYIRTNSGIDKITKIQKADKKLDNYHILTENNEIVFGSAATNKTIFIKDNIIDLIEYMDLLNIENPIKLYDKEIEVSLFNPVRCDGFTTYEDGTTCIILNLDYIVKLDTLEGKVGAILTHEQFNQNKYVVDKSD